MNHILCIKGAKGRQTDVHHERVMSSQGPTPPPRPPLASSHTRQAHDARRSRLNQQNNVPALPPFNRNNRNQNPSSTINTSSSPPLLPLSSQSHSTKREQFEQQQKGLNAINQNVAANQPGSGINSNTRASVNAYTKDVKRVYHPTFPTDEQTDTCNKLFGYCPLYKDIGKFPPGFMPGRKRNRRTHCSMDKGCGFHHKRVMLAWVGTQVYGNTRYHHEKTMLERYYEQFGRGCVQYHGHMLRTLTQTLVGKKLMEKYEDEAPGTFGEFRKKDQRRRERTLQEFAFVNKDPEDDDGGQKAHYVHVGIPLSERRPAFSSHSSHNDNNESKEDDMKTNTNGEMDMDMDMDMDRNDEQIDVEVMQRALEYIHVCEDDLCNLFMGEWCHVPHMMNGLEMCLKNVARSVHGHSLQSTGRNNAQKTVASSSDRHTEDLANWFMLHSNGQVALRNGADNYQAMNQASADITQSSGCGGFVSGGRFNVQTFTDIDASIAEFPPTSVDDTRVTDNTVLHSRSTISEHLQTLTNGLENHRTRLVAALEKKLTTMREAVAEQENVNNDDDVEHNTIHDSQAELPWMDARFDPTLAQKMMDESTDRYYTSDTDRKRPDGRVFHPGRSKSVIAYSRSCDNIDTFGLTFVDFLSILHEAGADHRLILWSLDASTYKHWIHLILDMGKENISTRHILGCLEPWHMIKSALKKMFAAPDGQLFLETQLWIKYWTGSNEEIIPSRISLRHSQFSSTFMLAMYFERAWIRIKDDIFRDFQDLIDTNPDAQMLVYQYNVTIPILVGFMHNITSSPESLFESLYDLAHVLYIGNSEYFQLCLWLLADIAGWKGRESKYFEEVIMKNPHIIASAIGIELFHGFQYLLQSHKAEIPTEAQLNERSAQMDLYQEVVNFQKSRHGDNLGKGGSYSCPDVPTGENEKYHQHMLVAERIIHDSFNALRLGKAIDVYKSTWTLGIAYKEESAALPPEVLRLGTTLQPFGVTFEDKEITVVVAAADADAAAADAAVTTQIVIKTISADDANGAHRQTALRETAGKAGDVVLGLVSGAKHTVIFDAVGKTAEQFVVEMNRLQNLKKQINVSIQPSSVTSNVVRGNKMYSKVRGSYPAAANPRIAKVDDAVLQKMIRSQSNFHRLATDESSLKEWDHPRMAEFRLQVYPRIKEMFARNVATTLATDRPVFPTEEKHHGGEEKREPKKMTELCAALHACVVRRSKKEEEEAKKTE